MLQVGNFNVVWLPAWEHHPGFKLHQAQGWRSAEPRLWNSPYFRGGGTSKGKAHEKLIQRCQVISMRPHCRSPLVWLEHFWQVSQAEQSSAGMWSTKDEERAQDMLILLPVRLSRGGLPLSQDIQKRRTEINARARADKISLLPSFKWLAHPGMKILSSFTKPYVIPVPLCDFLSSPRTQKKMLGKNILAVFFHLLQMKDQKWQEGKIKVL